MDQVAQVGAGLGFGRVRPEQERQVLALQGGFAMQQQVGQEGLQAGGIQPRDRFPVKDQVEGT